MTTSVRPITPPPGSDLALAAGCLCPVLDNRHGAGVCEGPDGPIYVMNAECPLHGAVMLVLPGDETNETE